MIVVFSYWQTIFAYPKGGGSYIVTKDNLGTLPGLIAAAALLIDYVLTVSVSIASGVQNLASIPFVRHWNLDQHLVGWCLLFIALLTLANLRGLKESGALFAVFTYGFVVMCYVMIAVALYRPGSGLDAASSGNTAGLPALARQSGGGHNIPRRRSARLCCCAPSPTAVRP